MRLKLSEKKLTGFIFSLIIISSIVGFIVSININKENIPNTDILYKSGEVLTPNTKQGYISSNNHAIFWFIHVTDTQSIWFSQYKIDIWTEFLKDSYKLIKPLFIYHTGDIVDAHYQLLGGINFQVREEWEKYNISLYENNINSSYYFDLIGNHDNYADPGNKYFLNYSMLGRNFNAIQYSFKYSFSFGDYAFIGLHTPDNFGVKMLFGLFGELGTSELNWYENELEKYKTCKKIFVFGHHPPFQILSKRSSNFQSFFDLNAEYGVDYYFSGHVHTNSFQNINNMLSFTTDIFENEGGSYRIVSIDNDQLSTSLEYVDKWPQGIITYPPQNKYLNQNIETVNKIRVLAWDPNGINSVLWSAFDALGSTQITNWTPLINVSPTSPLWEGNWSDYLNDGKKYQIRVKIEGGSGMSIKKIDFLPVITPSFGWFEAFPLLIIGFISLTIIMIYFFKKSAIYRWIVKKERDKKLNRLFIIKFLFFLICPLIFGGMFIGSVTTVFPFFFINSWGLHLSGILSISTATLLLFSFITQLLFRINSYTIIISVLNILIFFLLFILQYPTISWLSPGLWGMLYMDYLMYKYISSDRKQYREV